MNSAKPGASVTTKLPPDAIDALDHALDCEEELGATRTEAVRVIVKDWLTRRGYLRNGETVE